MLSIVCVGSGPLFQPLHWTVWQISECQLQSEQRPTLYHTHLYSVPTSNRLTKRDICLLVLQIMIFIYCINIACSGSTQLYVVYTRVWCLALCVCVATVIHWRMRCLGVFVPYRDPALLFHTQDKHITLFIVSACLICKLYPKHETG